jgi:hypothetical protein
MIWYPPSRQYVGAGVELVQTKEGFVVAEHLGEDGELVASVGVIRQGNNFKQIIVDAELASGIIRVKGTGTKLERRYQFERVADPIPIEPSFDFGVLLDGLGSVDLVDRILALPEGWFWMPYERRQLIYELTAGTLQSCLQNAFVRPQECV